MKFDEVQLVLVSEYCCVPALFAKFILNSDNLIDSSTLHIIWFAYLKRHLADLHDFEMCV